MPIVLKSSVAERDICDILLYVGHEERSPSGALRLVEAIESAANLYAANPLLGTERPDLGENIRVFSSGTKSNPHSCVVAYRPTIEGIEIVRIIRSGQNFTKLF